MSVFRTRALFQQSETLKLNGNALGGTFPVTLANLLSMEVLDLGDCFLGGMIPPTIGNMGALRKSVCRRRDKRKVISSLI